jgi:hypothetical protein
MGSYPEDVFALTVDRDTPVCIDTFSYAAYSQGTRVYVRNECSNPDSELACDNAACSPCSTNGASEVQFQADRGVTYYVFVEQKAVGDIWRPKIHVELSACSRTERCDDELDNDADGAVDCEDHDCDYVTPCGESDCGNDEDDDGDDLIDCRDPDCDRDRDRCYEVLCSNGNDDDDDGLVDCSDPNCQFAGECLDPAACRDLPVLQAGANTGSTTEGSNDFDALCTKGTVPRDQAWELSASAGRWYCLDTFGSGTDNTLSIRTACEDATSEVVCNDNNVGSNSRLQFRAPSDGTYTVIVETIYPYAGSDQTRWGPYQINMAPTACWETVCDDGLDEDGDGDTDCDDSECTYRAACWELACDDDVDNDGDSSIDCDDGLGCAFSPACLPSAACSAPRALREGRNDGDTTSAPNHFAASCGGAERHDEAWTLTPSQDGTVCITATWGVLSVRDSCLGASTEIVCDDDTPTGSLDDSTPRVEFETRANETYYVIFDGEEYVEYETRRMSDGAYAIDVLFGPCPPVASP